MDWQHDNFVKSRIAENKSVMQAQHDAAFGALRLFLSSVQTYSRFSTGCRNSQSNRGPAQRCAIAVSSHTRIRHRCCPTGGRRKYLLRSQPRPGVSRLDSRDSHRELFLPRCRKRHAAEASCTAMSSRCALRAIARCPKSKRADRKVDASAEEILFLSAVQAPDDQLLVAPIALMRLLRREILRATVFLWIVPLDAPRASSGCAVFSALRAAS